MNTVSTQPRSEESCRDILSQFTSQQLVDVLRERDKQAYLREYAIDELVKRGNLTI